MRKSMDQWILSLLVNTLQIFESSLENYNFHTAVGSLKNCFYTNFCDVYLESTKPGISEGKTKAKAHCATLSTCLNLGLKAMSPLTPFLAMELQQYQPQRSHRKLPGYKNSSVESEVGEVLEICQAIRQLKSRNKISKKHDPKVHLLAQSLKAVDTLNKYLIEMNSCFEKRFHIVFNSWAPVFFWYLYEFGKTDLNSLMWSKLQAELQGYLERTSNEGFKKAASEAEEEF